jgi:hypothetical protein
MAINNKPIFTGAAKISWTNGAVTANTTTDLTSGTIYGPIFTADATNGGYVQKIRFRALGTNVATVARVWINNGSSTGTAANNTLYDEISLPGTTSSQTSALANYELALNFALPAGYAIYVTLGTTVAAGYDISVIGGSYTALA